MGLKNFLPLNREIMDHWIYKDSDYLKIWVEMLFVARYSKEPKKELYRSSLYILNQGEFLFSRVTWGKRLHIKDYKLKKLINLLKDDNMIIKVGQVGSSGATIFKIVNYKRYNEVNANTPAINIDTTAIEGGVRQPQDSHTPAIGQPLATKEERKKEKKKEEKDIYSKFVELTKSEYEKLIEKFGEIETLNFIERLNNYIGSTGKKYKSHYYTILSWSRKNVKEKPKSNSWEEFK